jgi:hypothetical protein
MIDYQPKAITPGKGLQGQNCNVTACQKPDSALYYNKAMRAWYCKECATDIQYWASKDNMVLFDALVNPDPEEAAKESAELERKSKELFDRILNSIDFEPWTYNKAPTDEAVIIPKKVVAKHPTFNKSTYKPIRPIPVKKQGFRR